MDTELRQKAKNNFEKDLFKLMNTAVFGKIMKNVSKHRNIEVATREKRTIIQYQTILSCYKVIQKILMSNGKDKKSNINE